MHVLWPLGSHLNCSAVFSGYNSVISLTLKTKNLIITIDYNFMKLYIDYTTFQITYTHGCHSYLIMHRYTIQDQKISYCDRLQ